MAFGAVGSRAGTSRAKKVCLTEILFGDREEMKFMISKIGNFYMYKMGHTHTSTLISEYAKHCGQVSSIHAS
jgi:hypothetical protein